MNFMKIPVIRCQVRDRIMIHLLIREDQERGKSEFHGIGGPLTVSDQRIEVRKTGQDIVPFVEHRIFACDPSTIIDPFYLTGSNIADMGLGFKSPLKDKTKIEIDINPSEQTKLFFTTGSNTGVINSGLAYYNFDLDRFEVHGDLTTGSNIDFFNPGTCHDCERIVSLMYFKHNTWKSIRPVFAPIMPTGREIWKNQITGFHSTPP